jgi:hypothetical protein
VVGPQTTRNGVIAIDPHTTRSGVAWDHRSAFRGILFALDHAPLASVIEERQANCNSGGGHLLVIIKPKIVRHAIILSANYLFLLTPTGLRTRC